MNDKTEEKKARKKIKWYTYVDEDLKDKLEAFMQQFNVNNRAKIIRHSVNHYIDHVTHIQDKELDIRGYEEENINAYISQAIDAFYLPRSRFLKQLKQQISPLKTAILMLRESLEDSELISLVENAEKAVNGLESSVKLEMIKPTPQRFVRNFDILHVEDNELDRKVIHDYFTNKGIRIKSVETAEEALDLLNHCTPKVFLVDYSLDTSRMNGDQLCKIIKTREEYKHKPIHIITAMITEKQSEDLKKRSGAESVIMKPIRSLSELDVIIKDLDWDPFVLLMHLKKNPNHQKKERVGGEGLDISCFLG